MIIETFSTFKSVTKRRTKVRNCNSSLNIINPTVLSADYKSLSYSCSTQQHFSLISLSIRKEIHKPTKPKPYKISYECIFFQNEKPYLLFREHRPVANSNDYPTPCQLRWRLRQSSIFSHRQEQNLPKIRKKSKKGSDLEKKAMAVVQAVKGATVDDSFIRIWRRKSRSHHGIILNRH